jgi:hypothetical protein
MELKEQIQFKNNPKYYQYLKENSNYIKLLNRGVIDYRGFSNEMKKIYKERVTDKLESVVDNIDIINSVLDILK